MCRKIKNAKLKIQNGVPLVRRFGLLVNRRKKLTCIKKRAMEVRSNLLGINELIILFFLGTTTGFWVLLPVVALAAFAKI
jgi:hypothetical protein